ncbi:LicD family protein [Pedobacter cryoconitis]|uniref:LicD family protein n=1 Tax=Pedobacter cryoconitis TaxID=188932 RepID=A0A127V8T7_9SPHI|nr:LicD family protein [Pedobacter cryoconitis]AMP97398.1 LicD family protein [Pedobacter cryoconitis]
MNTNHYDWPADDRDKCISMEEQVHCVLLRMLKIFDLICTKHDITYWLDYGTLLGAVRNKGFIPWDMEIDIGMPRHDFDTFKKVGIADLPVDLFFQDAFTDPDYLHSHIIEAKIRDRYSNYIEFEQANPECKWHNGIQIDIFVYDLDSELRDCISNSFERVLTNKKAFFFTKEFQYLLYQQFGDTQFPIPDCYHAYLTRNYGDYLVLPPIEEQVAEIVNPFDSCQHKESLTWKNKP